ncbi:hypothetical protein [Bacillus sp. Marseille-Q3570]|uniref:hypothetical protein n=1 Tax=Bacillus sp. Marseille-Q3570 TaxID=2963522 RepID=UPI0028DBAEC6|nr:hypothetical protein [Bacillus sp. Marseille-Q3570]
MREDLILSDKEAVKAHRSNERRIPGIIADIRSLLKGLVLVSNVLPVFTGFWLALYFTNASFAAHWEVFLLTIIGSTLVMAGALVLNNWYDADIEQERKNVRR